MIFGHSRRTRDEALSYPGACPERHHRRQLFAQGLIVHAHIVSVCEVYYKVYVQIKCPKDKKEGRAATNQHGPRGARPHAG